MEERPNTDTQPETAPSGAPRSATDPPTMKIRGTLFYRRDARTAGGHDLCSLVVLVRHETRDGQRREVRFPVDFWDNRVPVAREGAEVEVEFRVAPRTMPDGRTFAALRGVVCREIPPPSTVVANDERRDGQ